MDCESIVNPREQDLAPIARTFERWRESLRAGDLDRLVDLVTEDVEFWSHAQPPLRGRESVREAFAPIFVEWTLDQAFECHELIVAGDLAFARGMEVNRLDPRGDGDAVTQRQRAFSVLRKGPDGVWRFARGMTNAPPGD